jgi:ParB family chromosome partitioning protein
VSARVRKYAESMDMLELIETRLIKSSSMQLRQTIGDVTELMDSIRNNGILQPLVVRPLGRCFEIVAGNRRFEACKRLRWRVVPCLVRELRDKEAYELSIVENVQRDNLTLVEEAKAYRRYVDEFGWGGVTELAEKLGRSPAYISHSILLLKLPSEVLRKVDSGEISRSAAQELLWTSDPNLQTELAKKITHDKLTVKEVRRSVKSAMEDYPWKFVSDKRPRDYIILEKSALAIRIAIIRIDSLIERCDSQKIKKHLMKSRFELHQMLDDMIRRKKDLSSL